MLDTIVNGVEASLGSVIRSNPPVEMGGQDLVMAEVAASVDAPPYVSPKIRVDYETQQVVLEYRDSQSGEVTKTISSEQAASAYDRGNQIAYQENAASITDASISEDDLFITKETSVDINQQTIEDVELQLPNDAPSSTLLKDGDTSSFV